MNTPCGKLEPSGVLVTSMPSVSEVPSMPCELATIANLPMNALSPSRR
jgi:hypothetical protein